MVLLPKKCERSTIFLGIRIDPALITGENLIDFAVDVSKGACASECEALLGCDVYTYHYPNSTSYPSTCFLLTELLRPIREHTHEMSATFFGVLDPLSTFSTDTVIGKLKKCHFK